MPHLIWKRSFRAMHFSNSKSWRCANEAFVRCFLQIPTVEDVKFKLWCDASFKFINLKMWKRSFHAMPPSNLKNWRCENKSFVQCFLQIHGVEDVKTKLWCNVSFKCEKWKMWKRSFRAMPPSNSKSLRCENEAFVQCFLQIWKVEDVKFKLWCDASFKFEKWKIWKRFFRAMPSSNLKSGRCEKVAFVRCLLQVWKVEDVKTNLSCDASLKF